MFATFLTGSVIFFLFDEFVIASVLPQRLNMIGYVFFRGCLLDGMITKGDID